MLSKRHQILSWVQDGLIAPENTQRAMEVAGVLPGTQSWHRFVEKLLLWLGVLSTTLGVIFFIAFNWDAMGKMGKFALIEGALAVSLLPLIWRDASTRVGQLSLLGGAILTGGLLALFGQTYQTGADTWQLFATWGMLILPWAWMSRFEPLWLLWIGVVNVAIILYTSLFGWAWFPFFATASASSLAALAFNGAVVLAWERLWHDADSHPRIGIRFPATLAGIAATWLGIDAIFQGEITGLLWFGIWGIWFGINCWVYRQKIRDLFMLTGGCLSAIVMLVAFLGENLLSIHWGAGELLIIALALIFSGSAAAAWLRSTTQMWEDDDA
jgi:uncharacterized membrane protein